MLLRAGVKSWHWRITAVPESPFATGDQPRPVAIDPRGTFVFVGNAGGNSLCFDCKSSRTKATGFALSAG